METKNQLGKIAEDIVQSTTIMETQALERNVQNTQLQELLFPIETQLWEVKNLNDPQEFKQAIQLLIKWYKHISKHTSLW